MVRTSVDPVRVPAKYPTAAVFVDESGSRASANEFFVVAALKVRRPGKLAREVRAVRDARGFTGEFKFADITRGSVPVHSELISLLEASDATVAACVVSGDLCDPFEGRSDTWRVHAEITSQLLVGCINRRELVGVHLDAISTPAGESLEDTVRERTNSRLRRCSVVSAVCLDSRTNDLLQVADIVAGAIRHERTLALSPYTSRSCKGQVARRLAMAFERPQLADGRDTRLNIATYRGSATRSTARSRAG